MLRMRAAAQRLIFLSIALALGGCFQGGNHQAEEQDAHFRHGTELAGNEDFPGAAQEFEKALDDNPRSAAAHFELGWLYDTKLNDYAAAIYHYQRHLALKPNSARAGLVQDRIRGCKQELADSEYSLPKSPNLQHDVDRLNLENAALKKQVDELQKQLASATARPSSSPENTHSRQYAFVTRLDSGNAETSFPSHPRTHIVRAHETVTAIAAEYRLKTSAILAANPGTDPRRLRVGQSLNLP